MLLVSQTVTDIQTTQCYCMSQTVTDIQTTQHYCVSQTVTDIQTTQCYCVSQTVTSIQQTNVTVCHRQESTAFATVTLKTLTKAQQHHLLIFILTVRPDRQ